jgi:hypothetical protein
MQTLLLLLAIAQPVPPAPPVIPPSMLVISGPSIVVEHNLARYYIDGAPNAGWFVYPPGSGSTYEPGDGSLIFTAAPNPGGVPAIYQLTAAVGSIGGKTTFLTKAVTVNPDPGKTPPVPPVVNKKLAIAIFDPTTLTSLSQGHVAIYQSPTIASRLASANVTWLQYDADDVIPTKGGSHPILNTSWGSAAKSVGLPALVKVNGSAISAVPLPASEADLLSLATR